MENGWQPAAWMPVCVCGVLSDPPENREVIEPGEIVSENQEYKREGFQVIAPFVQPAQEKGQTDQCGQDPESVP